mmetsp:Transcript_79531/g.176508  ORF Transcript_79531/g.176508 Transcript_79531/m.176508 type:complete len:124 (-) Transcript_79531:1-372(-)
MPTELLQLLLAVPVSFLSFLAFLAFLVFLANSAATQGSQGQLKAQLSEVLASWTEQRSTEAQAPVAPPPLQRPGMQPPPQEPMAVLAQGSRPSAEASASRRALHRGPGAVRHPVAAAAAGPPL